MKKLAIFVLVLVVLLGLALGYAAYNAGALAQKYKPQLERTISNAVGAPVTLGNIDVALFPSTALEVDRVAVGPADAQERLTLQNARLRLDLLALLSGTLRIVELMLDSPHITLVRDADGVSVVGLPRRQTTSSASDAAPGREAKGQPSDAQSGAPIALDLRRFALLDAQVTFNDTLNDRRIRVDDIDVQSQLVVQGPSLTLSNLTFAARLPGSVPFSLDAPVVLFNLDNGALSVDEAVLRLAGNRVVSRASLNTRTLEGSATTSSPGIGLESLRPLLAEFAPQIIELEPKGVLAPDFTVNLRGPGQYDLRGTLRLSKVGAQKNDLVVQDLSGPIAITAQPQSVKATSNKLTLSLGAQPIEIELNAGLQGERVVLEKLHLVGFGGQLTSNATLTLGASQQFEVHKRVEGMQVAQLLSALKPHAPPPLAGTLALLRADLNGVLGDELLQRLAGDLELTLQQGELTGVNLAGETLRAIKDLPFVEGALARKVPESLRAQIESSSTPIEELSGLFRVSGGKMRTDNLRLVSSLFSLTGDGSVGFDQQIDFNATISFSQELSLALAASVKELSRVLNEEQRLVVPLSIKGTAPNLMVVPNLDRLLTQGAKQAIKEKAGEALGKLFGGDKKKRGLPF